MSNNNKKKYAIISCILQFVMTYFIFMYNIIITTQYLSSEPITSFCILCKIILLLSLKPDGYTFNNSKPYIKL